MKFALYRGESWISSVIRWETRSVYSHVALWFPDACETYEAIGSGFVKAGSLGANHERGAKVDVFDYTEPLCFDDVQTARRVCQAMVGAPYDYEQAFAGWPLRYGWERRKNRDKFFCSEAAAIVAAAINRPIVATRVQPWKVAPEDVFRSLALHHDMSLEL